VPDLDLGLLPYLSWPFLLCIGALLALLGGSAVLLLGRRSPRVARWIAGGDTPSCDHPKWLDTAMPKRDAAGAAGSRDRDTVHTRIAAGYDELKRQRDLESNRALAAEQDAEQGWTFADTQALAWAAEVQELKQQIEGLERQNSDHWETIDDLEREIQVQRDCRDSLRIALADAWSVDPE